MGERPQRESTTAAAQRKSQLLKVKVMTEKVAVGGGRPRERDRVLLGRGQSTARKMTLARDKKTAAAASRRRSKYSSEGDSSGSSGEERRRKRRRERETSRDGRL